MLERIGRSWQLGKLAANMAQLHYRRQNGGSAQARRRLVNRLVSLHGLPQKIGQILSLSELTDPAPAYRVLTEGPMALTADVAFSEMEKALGSKLSEHFQSVDKKGISASLGQVHRAVLLDGRDVAVKVQYPGIADALRLDLRALGWLTAPVGSLRRGFNLGAYQEEVGRMISEELDYRHEAEMIRRFNGFTAGEGQVQVPEVIENLSGERILTMTWITGEPFSKIQHWSEDHRQELSRCLLRIFLAGCFEWGHLHADPHPGNYRFRRRNGQVVVGLLDFGCVKKIEKPVVDALNGLIQAVIHGTARKQKDQVFSQYLQMGFDPDLLAPMADLLVPLTQALFVPFCSREPFPLHAWNLGGQLEEILGEYRWNFRIAGPAELIYFIRAYQGLIQYLKALEAPVNWREVLDEIRSAPVSEPTSVQQLTSEKGYLMKSKSLLIRVSEGKQTRVKLTFPASAVENLIDLVPAEMVSKLERRNIDVGQIARDAVATDFEPGELFQMQEGAKCVRVWLE